MKGNLARHLAEVDALLTLVQLKSRAVRRQDINEPRTQILFKLFYATDKKVPQVELADALQLSVSQIQKLTEDLQDQALVTREAGAPRGGFFVHLSSKGSDEVKSLLQHRAENEFSFLDRLLTQHSVGSQPLEKVIESVKNELEHRAA